MCVFFFRVCVLCVSLARGHGEEHEARGRALHWECAPRRNSKQMCQTLPGEFPKIYTDWWILHATSQKSTQIGEFSMRLSLKQLHNLKKTFRHYHATSPQTICTNLPTLPRDFPKDFYIFCQLHDLGTFVCDRNSREFLNMNGTHVDFTSNFLA